MLLGFLKRPILMAAGRRNTECVNSKVPHECCQWQVSIHYPTCVRAYFQYNDMHNYKRKGIATMKYFKKITGERIYLSPINIDDLEIYTKWMNDVEVVSNLGNYHRLLSLNNEKSALESLTTDGQNYAIVLTDGDLLIGGVSLNEVSHIHRTATAGIFIGEAEFRDKGYGTEAMRLMVEFGFKTLNLHNIMLTVHSDNIRAINSYIKVGFKEFGRRRDSRYIDGSYLDTIYMEVLDTDYFTPTAYFT